MTHKRHIQNQPHVVPYYLGCRSSLRQAPSELGSTQVFRVPLLWRPGDKMLESERQFHRKTAAQCFNKTWDFLEKKNKNANDKQQMLYLAHTSRYHWSLVGTPRNNAVGDWQISRVYAALGQPSLALQFAKSSLEICQRNDLSETLHTAYEAMARASAVAGNVSTARSYIRKPRSRLGKLSLDNEDRKTYQDQILETEKLIGQ